jgi:hypothetical protein
MGGGESVMLKDIASDPMLVVALLMVVLAFVGTLLISDIVMNDLD